MGITNEVKNYFKNRIKNVLDEKKSKIMREIKSKIDIEDKALLILDANTKEYNIIEAISDYNELKEAKDKIDSKFEEAANLLGDIGEEIGAGTSYRYTDRVGLITKKAVELYEEEIISREYPEQFLELCAIAEAERNSEVAIMLATTEPKLVTSLTKVLESYGGTLGDLKKFVGLE